MTDTARVLVQTDRTVDSETWSRQHATGALPGGMPYGLDHLAGRGYAVTHRDELRGQPRATLARALRLVGHRWDWWGARALSNSTDADVNLCWDERSGIPMGYFRKPGSAPLITGAIWLTDQLSMPKPHLRIARTALSRAAAVWALSAGQLPALTSEFGVPAGKLHRLGFGIDTDFWQPGDAVPGDKVPVTTVLAVGNDRDRDHRTVVRAMAPLARSGGVRLHLVTELPVDVPPECGQVTPRLTHVRLREAYDAADIVVMASAPNLHVSGMTTILEAQAMGKPIVATRSPGVEDYLVDGATGVLVPSGDVDALSAAVRDLVSDPDRRRAMGRHGREFVRANASAGTQAAQLDEIIRTVRDA